jgi:hypothetical protein
MKGGGYLINADLPIAWIGKGKLPGSMSFRIRKVGFLFASQRDVFSTACKESEKRELKKNLQGIHGFVSKRWGGYGQGPFKDLDTPMSPPLFLAKS